VYGLAATGLVLTFRTSGVFNFAHGAIGALAAYGFYDLHVKYHLPWPVAALVCVVLLGLVVGLGIERLTRGLSASRPVMTIVGTIGLLLAIQGLLSWRYGPSTRGFPPFLPTSGVFFAGVRIQYAQMITFAIGSGASMGLYLFLRTNRLGIAMRGVVDDPALLSLIGTRPARVRAASWVIGSAFAALGGILIAPLLGRDPYLLTLLVVQAFGAAALGAFSSLPLAYGGGLVLGVAASLTTKFVGSSVTFRGLPSAIPFIILFVALLTTRKRRLAMTEPRRVRMPPPRAPDRRAAITGLILVGGFFVAVPWIVGTKLPVYVSMVILILIFLSLALLVWTSNQISLCHSVFAAVGATTFSHLTHGLGMPWGLALLLAGVAAIPVGAIVAVPAIRLSGVYLALATFGFGLLMERVVFNMGFMFGTFGHRSAPRPDLPLIGGQSDRSFYYVVLFVAVLTCIAMTVIGRTRLGRLLRGLADSPVALNTSGVSVIQVRLLVFCLSAFVASVGGALMIANSSEVSVDSFATFNSLLWLAVLAICGRFAGNALVRSAVLAAAVLAVLPVYAPSGFTDYQTMLFGAAAVAAAVLQPRVARSLRLRRQPVPGPIQARWLEYTVHRSPAIGPSGDGDRVLEPQP
jgi:branched-subunit amino acid ABC-type transport system permease component